MGVSQEADSFEFAGYLGVLRRRWWIVVILASVGILGAGAYVAGSPKGYTATATVNVTATGISQNQGGGAVAGGRTSSAVNLDTEVQIVQSSSVAAIAASDLHSSLTPQALVKNISVAVPANSSVLQISCAARSAQQSAACANAFAAAYLTNRTATATNTNNAQLKTIRNQLTALEKRTAQLSIQSRSLPVNSPQRASAQAQLQTAASQLRALANQSAALSASGAAASGGSIITKATAPTTPSSPKKKIILPGGLLAGLLIGLVIAFAWDKRDTRIKNLRSLGHLGAPALLGLSTKDLDGRTLADPRSRAGQDFSELARSTTGSLGQDHQLVLVAGASAGAAASVVAANLAVALTRTHSAVILVCAGGSGTTGLLGVPESRRRLDRRAAAELAAGDLSVDALALQPAGFPGLRLVVLAEELHDLQHAEARVLAEQLRDYADYTVVEAPAGSAGPDSLALAEYCAAALLAVEVSATRREDIEESIQRIIRLGAPVLGLVAVPRLRLPAPLVRGPEPLSSGSARLRTPVTDAGATAPATARPWPDGPMTGEDDAAASVHARADLADGAAETD
jgi:capsular polysaccharide biosynthesis protein